MDGGKYRENKEYSIPVRTPASPGKDMENKKKKIVFEILNS
jgi:hypothetical protein